MSSDFLVCNNCGNVITKLSDSGVIPVCCGEEMNKLVPNTVDGVGEKHLPVITILDKHAIRVHVGSQLHPMEKNHYIQFVAVETPDGLAIKYLHPGDIPVVTFFVEDTNQVLAVYEYCNLHGLWKTALTVKEKESFHAHYCGLFL